MSQLLNGQQTQGQEQLHWETVIQMRNESDQSYTNFGDEVKHLGGKMGLTFNDFSIGWGMEEEA